MDLPLIYNRSTALFQAVPLDLDTWEVKERVYFHGDKCWADWHPYESNRFSVMFCSQPGTATLGLCEVHMKEILGDCEG